MSSGTDKGCVRSVNEDNCYICNSEITYMVVADGMGGHKGGKTASSMAIENIRMYLSDSRMQNCSDIRECLIECVNHTNHTIYKKASEDDALAGMGTTLVLFYLDDNTGYVVNVGDSRCYIIRAGQITQVTKDHSMVQELVDNGKLQPSEMKTHPGKNIITRAVGTNFNVKCDVFEFPVKSGDGIILCSDGLSNMVDDNEILDIFVNNPDLDMCVSKLIDRANNSGGTDNITVAVGRL